MENNYLTQTRREINAWPSIKIKKRRFFLRVRVNLLSSCFRRFHIVTDYICGISCFHSVRANSQSHPNPPKEIGGIFSKLFMLKILSIISITLPNLHFEQANFLANVSIFRYHMLNLFQLCPPPPQLSGCILFAPPPPPPTPRRTCQIFT